MVAAQFTGAGKCLAEVLCFCFVFGRACSVPPAGTQGSSRGELLAAVMETTVRLLVRAHSVPSFTVLLLGTSLDVPK